MKKVFETVSTNDIVTVTGVISAIYPHNDSLQLHHVNALQIENFSFEIFQQVVLTAQSANDEKSEQFVGRVGKIIFVEHDEVKRRSHYYQSDFVDYDPVSITVQFETKPKNFENISVKKNQIRRAVPLEIDEEKKRICVETKNEKETWFKNYVEGMDKEQLANAMKYLFDLSTKK